MHQSLTKWKLSALASGMRYIEQHIPVQLSRGTCAQPRDTTENAHTGGSECFKNCRLEHNSQLVAKENIKNGNFQCKSHFHNDSILKRPYSRTESVCTIGSYFQKRNYASLNHSPTCVQCYRNFKMVSPRSGLLDPLVQRQAAHLLVQRNRNLWDIFKRFNFGSYAVLDNVGEVCDSHHVPSHIKSPPYAETGQPPEGPRVPEVKAEWQVEGMRESCRIARSILNTVRDNIQVGMTTEEIDALVHKRIVESGAYPSPLNYQGFPKSVCTSVNNVACHGIPNNRQLLDGDIISVDVTVYYNGYHGDCCETFLVGKVDEAGTHLVAAARRCRDEAIAICGPGVPFSAIGDKVEEIAKQEKVTVVPCFIGHGIGHYFHGPPDIYHFYNKFPGTMEDGMTFTVEPIVAQGSEEVVILEDGWTAVMLDNGRAAQFEHTILITDKGHEILSDYY